MEYRVNGCGREKLDATDGQNGNSKRTRSSSNAVCAYKCRKMHKTTAPGLTGATSVSTGSEKEKLSRKTKKCSGKKNTIASFAAAVWRAIQMGYLCLYHSGDVYTLYLFEKKDYDDKTACGAASERSPLSIQSPLLMSRWNSADSETFYFLHAKPVSIYLQSLSLMNATFILNMVVLRLHLVPNNIVRNF